MHLILKEEFSCFLREINDPLVFPDFSVNRPMWKSNDKLKIEVRQICTHIFESQFLHPKLIRRVAYSSWGGSEDYMR